MLGISGQSKAKIVAIDQGLTENSVSAHHIIELLLNLNDYNL